MPSRETAREIGEAVIRASGEIVEEACALPWWAWRRRRAKLREAALAGRLGVMLCSLEPGPDIPVRVVALEGPAINGLYAVEGQEPGDDHPVH
jgi:hypothetical protein